MNNQKSLYPKSAINAELRNNHLNEVLLGFEFLSLSYALALILIALQVTARQHKHKQ